MKLKLTLAKLFLFALPIVAGEAITILPSQAATFASFEARLLIYKFSYNLQDVEINTNTNTNTLTLETNGVVAANATAIEIANITFEGLQWCCICY